MGDTYRLKQIITLDRLRQSALPVKKMRRGANCGCVKEEEEKEDEEKKKKEEEEKKKDTKKRRTAY